MAKNNVSGAVGRGGVNPAPTVDDHTVRVAAEKAVQYVWTLSDREKKVVRKLGT